MERTREYTMDKRTRKYTNHALSTRDHGTIDRLKVLVAHPIIIYNHNQQGPVAAKSSLVVHALLIVPGTSYQYVIWCVRELR